MTHSRRPFERAQPLSIKYFYFSHLQGETKIKDEIFKCSTLKKMKKRALRTRQWTLGFLLENLQNTLFSSRCALDPNAHQILHDEIDRELKMDEKVPDGKYAISGPGRSTAFTRSLLFYVDHLDRSARNGTHRFPGREAVKRPALLSSARGEFEVEYIAYVSEQNSRPRHVTRSRSPSASPGNLQARARRRLSNEGRIPQLIRDGHEAKSVKGHGAREHGHAYTRNRRLYDTSLKFASERDATGASLHPFATDELVARSRSRGAG